MKGIPTTPPPPNTASAQDFSCVPYLELAHLATAFNYKVKIAPTVYMAFQARPTSPVRTQPDSGMGCDNLALYSFLVALVLAYGF
ncbi:hypothetical protein DSO57_1037685 [Entomophthora muscae]|uniref:Uncharacterized protein n=1 Tax=Entomophthora muscae TaxID=34485 RepID=A0ACC2UJP7_9FUNG|nr:hypothetical protein DSO57_1037685 [Entomophthora muscae]